MDQQIPFVKSSHSAMDSSTPCTGVVTPDPSMSETESDTSSIQGDRTDNTVDSSSSMKRPANPMTREQMTKRLDSIFQENKVLKMEVETLKLRTKSLQSENSELRKASVAIQARAEQEEEYISNSLLKKITELQKEKELLAHKYEEEEICITKELSKKLDKIKSEKHELAEKIQKEQESVVSNLVGRIKKLEAETAQKQVALDSIRREKVNLENTLEQEQEALVNRMWKRLDKLEHEKKYLQGKLNLNSAPPSPMDVSTSVGEPVNTRSSRNSQSFSRDEPPRVTQINSASSNSILPMPQGQVRRKASESSTSSQVTPTKPRQTITIRPEDRQDTGKLMSYINQLRDEIDYLRNELGTKTKEGQDKDVQLTAGEQENLRLRRKLELEKERRSELFRHLSESESSLEMEDERMFNELSQHGAIPTMPPSSLSGPISRVPPSVSPSVIASGRMSPLTVNPLSSQFMSQSANVYNPAYMQHVTASSPSGGIYASPPSPMGNRLLSHIANTGFACHVCGTPLQHNLIASIASAAPAYMMALAAQQQQAQHVSQQQRGRSAQSALMSNHDEKTVGQEQMHSRSMSNASTTSERSNSKASNVQTATNPSSFARPANPPSAPPAPLFTAHSPKLTTPNSPSAARSRTPEENTRR